MKKNRKKRKKREFSEKDHTFVICAYKENPMLEKTIKSLLAQSKKSNLIVSTSTPNSYIQNICKKYQLPLKINEGESSIAKDLTFGYGQADTALVTIAHQDDIYESNFLEEVLKKANEQMLICFTDYYEIRNNHAIKNNYLLNIKRMMQIPLRISYFRKVKWIRKTILRFGNPICCPSVTLNKRLLGNHIFDTKYKNSCDYKTWVKIADKKGEYIYIAKCLMGHRIWQGSTTSYNIDNKIREKEDLEIMETLWPKSIARGINRLYQLGEKSNKKKERNKKKREWRK